LKTIAKGGIDRKENGPSSSAVRKKIKPARCVMEAITEGKKKESLPAIL